jgi:hypothetical protein
MSLDPLAPFRDPKSAIGIPMTFPNSAIRIKFTRRGGHSELA